MGLTDAQALYVERVEAFRKALTNCTANAARALLAYRRNLLKLTELDPAMHAEVYGTTNPEAGATIALELGNSDGAIKGLFASGLIAQTREDMEAELERQPHPPIPGF